MAGKAEHNVAMAKDSKTEAILASIDWGVFRAAWRAKEPIWPQSALDLEAELHIALPNPVDHSDPRFIDEAYWRKVHYMRGLALRWGVGEGLWYRPVYGEAASRPQYTLVSPAVQMAAMAQVVNQWPPNGYWRAIGACRTYLATLKPGFRIGQETSKDVNRMGQMLARLAKEGTPIGPWVFQRREHQGRGLYYLKREGAAPIQSVPDYAMTQCDNREASPAIPVPFGVDTDLAAKWGQGS